MRIVDKPSAEKHLSELRQLLQKHGGAASYSQRKKFYDPNRLKKALEMMPSRTPRICALRAKSWAKYREKQMTRLQKQGSDDKGSRQPPQVYSEIVEKGLTSSLIDVERRTGPTDTFSFRVPRCLRLLLTQSKNTAADQERAGRRHFHVPLFLVNMTVRAVCNLRSAIKQMDQLEDVEVSQHYNCIPELKAFQSGLTAIKHQMRYRYLMFVTVRDDQDVNAISAKSGKDNLLYFIRLPACSSDGRTSIPLTALEFVASLTR